LQAQQGVLPMRETLRSPSLELATGPASSSLAVEGRIKL